MQVLARIGVPQVVQLEAPEARTPHHLAELHTDPLDVQRLPGALERKHVALWAGVAPSRPDGEGLGQRHRERYRATLARLRDFDLTAKRQRPFNPYPAGF